MFSENSATISEDDYHGVKEQLTKKYDQLCNILTEFDCVQPIKFSVEDKEWLQLTCYSTQQGTIEKLFKSFRVNAPTCIQKKIEGLLEEAKSQKYNVKISFVMAKKKLTKMEETFW